MSVLNLNISHLCFDNYLSTLYLPGGNPVHMRIALDALRTNFSFINSLNDVTEEERKRFYFYHLLMLRYIADAQDRIEEELEEDDDISDIKMPNLISEGFFSKVGTMYTENRISDFTQPEKIDRFDALTQFEHLFETICKQGYSSLDMQRAIHTLIICIVDSNSESGLTSLLKLIEDELDISAPNREEYPSLAIEESRLGEFDFEDEGDDCSGDWDADLPDEDEEEYSELEAELVGIRTQISTCMSEALRPIAIFYGIDVEGKGDDELRSSLYELVETQKLDSGELFETIIETEEDLRQAEVLRILENEARIRDVVLDYVITKLSNIIPVAGHKYVISCDRMMELTGGNRLPVNADYVQKVTTSIACVLNVRPHNVRLILTPESMAFMFIDSDSIEGGIEL